MRGRHINTPKWAKKIAGFISTNFWFVVDAQILGVPVHISPPHIWWDIFHRPEEWLMINISDGPRYARFLGLTLGKHR